MSDPLTQFYDSLATEADVLALLAETRPEDLHLELKRKQNPTTLALESRDAEHFSKGLSGFANSDGGVLLWGVGSNKREEAATLHPVSDPHAFQRSLDFTLERSSTVRR